MSYLHRCTLARLGAGALAVALLHGCATAPAPASSATAASANVYTAESTYAKLVGAYPAIRIASAAVPASVTVLRDLIYASPGGRDLQLDLFLPQRAAAAKSPVIVFVHGGGWRVGGRAEFAPMAIRLAARGYASATISYRLADEAPYPAGVDDAGAALSWLRANAGKHGLDADQIVIAGGSAGGQIASLVGVTHGGGKVRAIVNIDGLSDFMGEVARLRGDPRLPQPASETAWFGGWFRDRSAPLEPVWRAASPLNYAGADSPPTLFIGSSVARFSVGREAMVEKLRGAGVASEVVLLPNTPHSFWLFEPWIDPTVEATASFLDRVLRPK